ncbi:MAG: hypothetical protein UT50_C0022G0008 [Candidatus Moranbacteria bacterium GW2011_GWA2_39_41]|nr:MAG: hypothetical protein UT50_C0022G0008 [Candidatus Moranbacteria bacterium GW2011_GWA2_39_41]
MFEIFTPKKEAVPQMPTFEELKMALPEELRDEFQKLREDIEKLAGDRGISMSVAEVDEDEVLSEEKDLFVRRDELQKMAMEKLQSK